MRGYFVFFVGVVCSDKALDNEDAWREALIVTWFRGGIPASPARMGLLGEASLRKNGYDYRSQVTLLRSASGR